MQIPVPVRPCKPTRPYKWEGIDMDLRKALPPSLISWQNVLSGNSINNLANNAYLEYAPNGNNPSKKINTRAGLMLAAEDTAPGSIVLRSSGRVFGRLG